MNMQFGHFAATRATLWRTLQTFNVSRIVIALLLLAFISVGGTHGNIAAETMSYVQLCGVYLLASIAFMLLTTFSRERFLLQLSAQMAADLLIISSLYIIAGGARSGLAILYLFPLAGAAVLSPRLIALFFTSVVALVLLATSLLESWSTASDGLVSTAGLYGLSFFFAVLVLNQLAAKLLKQEGIAEQRGQALRMQQAINQLIIADMGDGVLVVDRDASVITANPAAAQMLGWSGPHQHAGRPLAEIPALMPITNAFFDWSSAAHAPQDSIAVVEPVVGGDSLDTSARFVTIKSTEEIGPPPVTVLRSATGRDLSAHLKLRFARVDTTDLHDLRTVIFLQDVSEIENKAQDLKLASMGRLTASIAHEVRNPLSAISYAASLLEEEAPNPTQTRLLRIIDENVARLNRMIEDILKLSRKAQMHAAPLVLASFFAEVLTEFITTHRLADELVRAGDFGTYRVRFDPLHLREVVVNLLSNAVRYASGVPGSIRLDVMAASSNHIELHIRDDGPPISADVRAHLFEPFYTTSSKGTGLGLYLARELCLNNDAMLDYEYRHDPDDHSLPAALATTSATTSTTTPTITPAEIPASSHGAGGRFVITFATVTES